MRAINLLLFIALSLTTIAQGVPTNSSKKIKIKPGVQRLDSLLKQISKKTGSTFSFDTKKINASKSVNWILKDATLKEVLSELNKLVDIEAIEVEDHIVLISRPGTQKAELRKSVENSEPIQKPVVKKSAPDNELKKESTPLPATSLSPSMSTQTLSREPKIDPLHSPDKNRIDTIETISPDSIVRPASNPIPTSIQAAQKINPANEVQVNTNSLEKIPTLPPEKKPLESEPTKLVEEKKSFPLFIKAGAMFNEVMYANVALQVGSPALYGTLNAGTNFKLTELRYGAGTSVKLSDTWRLNAQLDYGKTLKRFRNETFGMDSAGTPIDSTRSVQRIKVNGKSVRLTFFLEKTLTKNFTLQFGPTINVLKTEYFLNGKVHEAGSLGSNADKKYRTISPPFLISNTYNAGSSSNIKIWIGFQVGLFYRIKN